MWIWVVVISSLVWTVYDASQNRIPYDLKKPYSLWNGALGWGVGLVLLWIVFFPYYLVRRSGVLNERQKAASLADYPNPVGQSRPSGSSSVDELERLAQLKNSGILTEEEFQAKKKQVLGL